MYSAIDMSPDALHREYFRTQDPDFRERLVEVHAGLARALAQRFSRRGDGADDLTQIAFLGLLKAIDRFDPERGLKFSTYAMPTILGELKRHMRDQSWGIRPPRRVHDLYLEVERTVDDLTQEFGRKPTVAELADRLGTAEELVVEAMDAVTGRKLTSLEVPNPNGGTMSDTVGRRDRGMTDVERTLVVDSLLERLPPEDEEVVRMRFENDMTQLEIAKALGRSQMQISRTLSRSLDRLRRLAEAGADLMLAS